MKLFLKVCLIVSFVMPIHHTFAQLQGTKVIELPDIFLAPQYCDYDDLDIDLNNVVLGRAWIVYSAKKGNESYNSPSKNNQKNRNIGFLEEFYVIDIDKDYLHIVQDPNLTENILSKAAKDFGWINIENLLLSKHCLVTSTGKVDRKVMLLNTIEAVKQKKIKGEESLVHFYYDPELTQKTQKTSSLFQIFFLFKSTEDAFLIGTLSRIHPGTDPKTIVLGWVPRNRCVLWNHRVAIEPNWDKSAISERMGRGKKPSIFLDKEDAKKFTQGFAIPEERVLWESNDNELLKNGRLIGEWRRFPLYNQDTSAAFSEVGVMGKVTSKKYTIDDITIAKIDSLISVLRNKKRFINFIFVIDGTKSMQPYFEAVSKAIIKSMMNLKDLNTGGYKTVNKIRFGAIVYRDYAEGKSRRAVRIDLSTDYKTVAEELKNIKAADLHDKDQPEAVFYGINKAARDLCAENETNVMILIGDAGNHHRQDETQISIENLTSNLSKYNIDLNFLVFQVNRRLDHNTYNEFIPQIYELILNYSSDLYNRYIGTDINKLIKYEPKLVAGNNSYSLINSAISATIYYPDPGRKIDESQLVSYIPKFVKSVNDNTDVFINKLDEWRRGASAGEVITIENNSVGKTTGFAPAMILFLSKLGLTEDEIKLMSSKRFQMFQYGYSADKVKGLDYPMFRKSLLLSRLELGQLIKDLQRLVHSSSGNRRGDFYNAWIELLEVHLGDVDINEIKNKSMEEITKMLWDFATESITLQKISLKDILEPLKFSDNDLERSIDELEKSSYRLQKQIFNKDSYPQRFTSVEEVYYWVPANNMP